MYVNENNINISAVGINKSETYFLHYIICKCHSRNQCNATYVEPDICCDPRQYSLPQI